MELGPLKYVGPWGPYFWFKDSWILSRNAARLFAVSSILMLLWGGEIIAVLWYGIDPDQDFPKWTLLWVLVEVSLFAGGLFLWFGMWRYWLRLDTSRPWIKRVSFIALLLGAVWGASLYCLTVYLPRTLGRAADSP